MWNAISRIFSSSKTPEGELVEVREKEEKEGEEEEESSSFVIEGVVGGRVGEPKEADKSVDVFERMDRKIGEDRRKGGGGGGAAAGISSMERRNSGSAQTESEQNFDTHETRLAKQRASVKWLLSKAYNNDVPDNLREPYYRDHEDQEHLKPQIVHSLSNAELYCLALANIYSDPNYHNQNHLGILQALARKGVFVNEPNNTQLTETILIQNSPLKMSAHMAVIEGLMVLYAKEVVTGDCVIAAIRRFNPKIRTEEVPSDHEAGLLLWINQASRALVEKIKLYEGDEGSSTDKFGLEYLSNGSKDFHSLCDGVGISAVVAFYCPDEFNWRDIIIDKKSFSISDALHNLSLVKKFSNKSLPYSIFHMQCEDVTYMRGSMKQNLIVFLADLYNVLEIHPVKCVRYPGDEREYQYSNEKVCPRNSHGVAHKRSLPQSIAPIPDLRSNLSVSAPGFTVITKTTPATSSSLAASNTVKKSQTIQQTTDSHCYEDRRATNNEGENFVVHRGKGVPTLSSVADDKISARSEAAGRPSNWEDQRRSSYAGRRSRRNSVTDDSQLTIENFGGSQDNLHNFGRNPDKEVGGHVGRHNVTEPTLPARSSVQDVYGSGVKSILSDNGYSGEETTTATSGTGATTPRLKRQTSNSSLNNAVALKNILHSKNDDNNDSNSAELGGSTSKLASFAQLSRQQQQQQSSDKVINFTYSNQDKEEGGSANLVTKKIVNAGGGVVVTKKQNSVDNNNSGGGGGSCNVEKKTTFAALPNTTTWQQQSNQQIINAEANNADENGRNGVMASQLNNIRMKLEEKRRHIENEKRKMEVVMSKQRQKVGKAAFLQAVTKGKVKSPSSSTSGGESPVDTLPPGSINPTNISIQLLSSSSTSSSPSSVNQTTKNIIENHPSNQENIQQRPFSLKEISEDVRDVEHKWLEQDGGAPFIETRRTPDIENMDLDQYHESITQMNSSLSEIQADIQRLANQQNQIQQQHLMSQHQQQMQQQLQQLKSLSQQHLQNYAIPSLNSIQSRIQEPQQQQQSQFYLHDHSNQPQRRTWGQPMAPESLANEMAAAGYQQSVDMRYGGGQTSGYQQDPRLHYQDTRTWATAAAGPPQSHNQQKGFLLHETNPEQRYINGSDHSLCNNQMNRQGSGYPTAATLFSQMPSAASVVGAASPQHRNTVHRISQLMSDNPDSTKRPTVHHIPITCESPTEKRQSQSVLHTPVPAPSVDDMEPQNISFIGNDDDLSHGIRGLNITSGNRTYRKPSPTRPSISRNSFQQPHQSSRESVSPVSSSTPPEVQNFESNETAEKGFYISFDNDAPKKPKPALGLKRTSPKKERTVSSYIEQEDFSVRPESPPVSGTERQRQIEAQRDLERERIKQAEEREQQRQEIRDREIHREIERERQQRDRQKDPGSATAVAGGGNRQTPAGSGIGLVIGNQLANPDPNSLDEMEKKKERIMLLSLQRRQQQEELKEKKEAEAQARREREKLKTEERARKKEEERQKRAAILEQYKLKKAIEEAEKEGKIIDKELLNAIKPTKLRNKTAPSRPRPKTIHVDAGADLDSGALTPSRGKKGSSSNLSTASLISPTMRRDYYRGSQDSLTAAHLDERRSGPLYRGGSLRVSSVDSPDDGRGSSPCRSVNQLGRRGSYKTSRDAQEPQQQVRGRPKYPTYQNFKGRKSNSLMNLCGSTISDQESMMYRYTDTDSGLGRATPPRRAPSPGMGSMRHLPSPSGPGSLPPGLMTKRRMFDDGSSDISSTPSSMMDYNGPRLYKQPTTKSNRGIMLNAVEYCVFPGTVNKEAKRRVLDEISRSESKHFLILFRDAGCQFRALYSYCPDNEEVSKLYGTGPKQVNDRMFDKFFKYNSGGKCFSQVHTKHLTVTIDAFTIHNSLWQGKKVNLPNKKDMALVI